MISSKDYVARNFKAYHTPAEYNFGVVIPLFSAWRSKLSVDSTDINPGFHGRIYWLQQLIILNQSLTLIFLSHEQLLLINVS